MTLPDTIGEIYKWKPSTVRLTYWDAWVGSTDRNTDQPPVSAYGYYKRVDLKDQFLLTDIVSCQNIFSDSRDLFVFLDVLRNTKVRMFPMDAEGLMLAYDQKEDTQTTDSSTRQDSGEMALQDVKGDVSGG